MGVSIKRKENLRRQFFVSFLVISLMSVTCIPIADFFGYRAVALVLLLSVSLLALRMSLYPVLLAATLGALIWNFFFIPPQFTLHISNLEDLLMFGMYFIVALLNGVFSTRIRKAEEMAIQKEERESAAKLYDTIFNSLSHELRTPLATIIGASDNLISHETQLGEENKQQLITEINTAAERLNRLVDNLLSMSRLDSGSIKPRFIWCDLKELVFKVLNELSKELQGFNIRLNIPENLPLFKLDFGLMEEVLINIIYNASIYTPRGTEITVTCGALDNRCIIEILDNGPGFPKGDLELVFEKFFRSKNSRTGGIGLGLSIAKGFVDAHNGTINLENAPNGGAKFTISIPAETMDVDNVGDIEI